MGGSFTPTWGTNSPGCIGAYSGTGSNSRLNAEGLRTAHGQPFTEQRVHSLRCTHRRCLEVCRGAVMIYGSGAGVGVARPRPTVTWAADP